MAKAEIDKINLEEMRLSQLVLRCIKAKNKDIETERLNILFSELYKARVWLPVIKFKEEGEGRYSYTNRKRGDVVTKEEGTRIFSDRLQTPKGEIFLPVFTMRELAPADYREKFSWYKGAFWECCGFVKQTPGCSGIVLNPFSHNMQISRKILSVYTGEAAAGKEPGKK